jgi:DNA-directed RNA polymerase specialized sigma24 family protein
LIASAELRRRSVPESFYVEEDLLSSSNRVFFSSILEGKIRSINGLDELWVIYRRIAASRVRAAQDRLHAKKRGGLAFWKIWVGKSSVRSARKGKGADANDDLDLDLFESGLLPPEVSTIADETLSYLIGLLNDEQKSIANMRLDTLSVAEIARKKGRSERTINRKLDEIREIWRASGQLDGL